MNSVHFLVVVMVLLGHFGSAQDDGTGGLPSNLPSPPEPEKKKAAKKAPARTTPPPTRPSAPPTGLPMPPPSSTFSRPPTKVFYYDENSVEDNAIPEEDAQIQSPPEYDEVYDVVYEDDYPSNQVASESPSAPILEDPPEEPPPPPPEPEEPPHRAIFGLDHIILILVPSFKTKLPHLPDWAGSNVRVALPITIFFDKLTIHPPPLRPVTLVPLYGPFLHGGHFVKKRSVSNLEMDEDKSNEVVDPSEEMKEAGDLAKEIRVDSGHPPTPPPAPQRRSALPKRDVAFDESIYGAERVMLIPRLEKLLGSFGLGGKPCLLRAICETHEVPLVHHGYGLLGELLTLFFSISRSAFANTRHLAEYLEAEESGRRGNCSEYFHTCPTSIFYWEKTHHHNESHGADGIHSDQESHPGVIGLNETHYHPDLEAVDEDEEDKDDDDDEDDGFNEIVKQILSSRDLLN